MAQIQLRKITSIKQFLTDNALQDWVEDMNKKMGFGESFIITAINYTPPLHNEHFKTYPTIYVGFTEERYPPYK